MSDLALFDDQERLETFPPLGRLMRMGLPDELNVSNHKRLVEAIDQEDGSKCLAYLEHVRLSRFQHFGLIGDRRITGGAPLGGPAISEQARGHATKLAIPCGDHRSRSPGH